MTGATELFDFGKVFMIAGISVLVGVFVGSRSGGEYVFEIGGNMLNAFYGVLMFGVIIYVMYVFTIAIEKRSDKK